MYFDLEASTILCTKKAETDSGTDSSVLEIRTASSSSVAVDRETTKSALIDVSSSKPKRLLNFI